MVYAATSEVYVTVCPHTAFVIAVIIVGVAIIAGNVKCTGTGAVRSCPDVPFVGVVAIDEGPVAAVIVIFKTGGIRNIPHDSLRHGNGEFAPIGHLISSGIAHSTNVEIIIGGRGQARNVGKRIRD